MKLNKITLAVIAAVAAPVMANAGVTVSPLLLGYHYTDGSSTVDDMEESDLKFSEDSDLYTGAALGIELTPSTQFQVEYGVSDSEAMYKDAKIGDSEHEMISGNFLIGSDGTNSNNGAFRPYVLVGAGQSKIEVEDSAGDEIRETTDTIGNLGLGAMFRVNDALSLRGEARAIHNFDYDVWEGMALAGLEVVLGGHLSPTVEAPVVEPQPPVVETPIIIVEDQDSDGDGVIDKLDQCPNTPMNVVVDETGCPKRVVVEDDLQMELRVFFDNDKTRIKDQYVPEIAKVAEKMAEYPNSTASIEGHASKTGPSARYNQRLSEARAVAVKSMLTDQFGVAPNRLSTVGYGYSRPIAPNDTEEGRAMNRRVYAVITGNKSMTVEQTKDMNVN